MSAPPPDARESALERVLVAYARNHVLNHHMSCAGEYAKCAACAKTRETMEAARAELSALRASQGAVARELVELVDEYASEMRRLLDEDEEHEESGGCFSIVGMSTADVRDWLARYDALRPAATGEGDADAMLDEIEGVLNEFFGANRDDDRDTRPLREQLRAAIARAEGRKGTDG